MNKYLILCRSSCRHLVINLSYHTCILFVLGSFPYNNMYPLWLVASYSCTYFMLWVWTYYWWFGYPLVLMLVREWTHYSPWYFLTYCCNYCFGELNTCIKKRFSTFSLTTLNVELIFLSWEDLSRCHHNWSNLPKYGTTCIFHDNACNNSCSREDMIICEAHIQRWLHSPCHIVFILVSTLCWIVVFKPL
jgi:hypothetical protein